MGFVDNLMKYVFRALLVATVLMAAGCETTRPRPVDPVAVTNDVPVTVNSTDSLEPGNQITITFSGLSTIPIPYSCRIREDGTMSPPYLKEPVVANLAILLTAARVCMILADPKQVVVTAVVEAL